MKTMLTAAMLLVAMARGADAHDVWLTLEADAAQHRVIVNYGHPDDRPPAFVDKVVELTVLTARGETSLRGGLAQAEHNGAIVARSQPLADDGHALFGARYDNGFWAKTADGIINVTKRMAPDAAETLWSGKFAKAIGGPDAPWDRVLGHDIELVPLTDPARIVPGDVLKLRVLFRGKPLAGAEVERGDGKTAVPEVEIPRFRTDRDGVAAIPIVRLGETLLVVDHRVAPSQTPDVSADLFNATLWFEVKADR